MINSVRSGIKPGDRTGIVYRCGGRALAHCSAGIWVVDVRREGVTGDRVSIAVIYACRVRIEADSNVAVVYSKQLVDSSVQVIWDTQWCTLSPRCSDGIATGS